MPDDFEELVEKVSSVDPAAGLRLLEMEKNGKLDRCGFLVECFSWSNTKEGFDYWYSIERRLNENTTGKTYHSCLESKS